jgi:hypothetical protein
MIAEIIPEAYDAVGRKVMRPDLRSRGIHPTLPMGRYLGQPLSIRCETIEEVRKFLATCQGVSDRKLFGKEDYWQPPEDFERLRKGDCEDFSLRLQSSTLNSFTLRNTRSCVTSTAPAASA